MKKYKEYMDDVKVSDTLHRRLLELDRVKVRPRLRLARLGLVAACLCLALVGTAVAAKYFGVQIVEGTGADTVDVWMEGGVAYYPAELLSDELKALEDEHKFVRFNSWQEAEEFIGVDLMNNPVLDASPATNYFVKYTDDRTQHVSGRFILTTSVGLEHIRLHGCYEMGSVNIDVQGFLFTDRMKEKVEDWDERYYGIGFMEEPKPVMNIDASYTTSNGLEAQIMTVEYSSGYKSCLAAFSIDGFPFIVKARSDNLEEAREALFQVLDGFVLD